MDLINIFRRKTSSSKREIPPDSGFKKMIKAFYAMIKEEKTLFKEKKVAVSLTCKSLKEKESLLSSHLKSKIVDFIKNNFKEKGWKSDPKSFFVFTAKEAYFILIALLEEHKHCASNFTNDKIISFVKSFYDFYEGELYITNQDIIHQIIHDDVEDSYILCLFGILTYAKLCESLESILDKSNEMADFGLIIMKALYMLNSICRHVEAGGSKDCENMNMLLTKAECHILPNMTSFFIDIIDMPDLRTVFIMLDHDDLVKLFNDLSCLKQVRKCIPDIFCKVLLKEANRIHILKKYVEENKCMESILSNIKISYIKRQCDINETFKEIIDILIIHILFFEGGGSLFHNQVLQLILTILNDLYTQSDDLQLIEDSFPYFIKEIFNLSFLDREDMKTKLSGDRTKICDVSSSALYKNYDMINYLLTIFEFKEIDTPLDELQMNLVQDKQNFVRKTILHLILDIEIPLTKYRMMINNTDFCRSFLENLHECPEEIISYYFSVLLVLCENSNQASGFGFSLSGDMGSHIAYIPTKELASVIKCLLKCQDEEVLLIILKHFKSFLGLSSGFQKTFVNCGYFHVIVKIFHCALDRLESGGDEEKEAHEENPFSSRVSQKKKITPIAFEIEPSAGYKRSLTLQNNNNYPQTCYYTCQMGLHLLDFLELLLINNKDNVSNFINCGFHHSYFKRFYNFPKWSKISYKIWFISILYEKENEDISIKIFDILKRYYQLRESLITCCSLTNLKMILEEIMEINETIALIFIKDNATNNVLSLIDTHSPLKEILLDFPSLLEVYKENHLRLTELPPEVDFEEAENKHTDEVHLGHSDIEENTLLIIEEETQSPRPKIIQANQPQSELQVPKVWDSFIQNLVKKYFQIIFDLIHCYNRTLFTKTFKTLKLSTTKLKNMHSLDPIIQKESLSSIFEKIILFINRNDIGLHNFLTDLIKFLIDRALKFKLNNDGGKQKIKKACRKATDDNELAGEFSFQREDCDEMFTDNLVKYYQERYKIDDTFLNNSYSRVSNYTNFTLHSPMIIRNIIKSLTTAGNLLMMNDFLEFVEFLCKMNENNAKLLLRQSLVKDLLSIFDYFHSLNIYIPTEPSKSELKNSICLKCNMFNCTCNLRSSTNPEIIVQRICDMILDIFEIVSKFFNKSDLQRVFEYILISMNSNESSGTFYFATSLKLILNRLLSILYKNYKISHKINKNIIISCTNTRQPNVYNMIYAGGIKFSNQTLIPLGSNSKDVKTKPACLSIFLTMKFHQLIDNSCLTLFKLEREGKDKDKDICVLEFSIEKLNLIIKENDQEIQISNELKSLIRYDKNTHFDFYISKDSNELHVKVNRRLLCVAKPELKYLDLSGNASYSIMIGYPGTNTRDIYQDEFSSIPHISISYIMMYSGKVTPEFLDQFKLSQISSSKNGSIKADNVKLKYLNEKNYKTFAPTIVNNKNELFNLKVNIDPSKVVYELIADKLELLTNNNLERRKADQTFIKIQRKYYIDMTDKDYIVYIPKTTLDTYLTTSNNSFLNLNHTFLLSKFNFSDSMTMNQFFQCKAIKKTVLTDILCINSTLECEARCFRMVDYLLLLLNEVPSMDAPNQVKSMTILNILKLLGVHLISNICTLAEFSQTNYFKSLLIILYKNSEYLTGDVVDFFFNLSFGLEDGNKILFFNPWYLSFITDIILDSQLFQLMSNTLKMYTVTSIQTFLSKSDLIVINESDYDTKVVFLAKFYKFILTVDSDQAIDDVIISVIIIILEQLFKYKKGVTEPTQGQLNEVIHYTLEFLKISNNFNQPITEHLNKRNFDQNGLNATTYLVKKLFSKLFSDTIKTTRGILVNFFFKLMETMRYSQGDNHNNNSRRGSNFLQYARIEMLIAPIMKEIFPDDENNDYDNDYDYDNDNDNETLAANTNKLRSPFKKVDLLQSPLSKSAIVDKGNFLPLQSNDYVIVNSSADTNRKGNDRKPRKTSGDDKNIRMSTFECDIDTDNKNTCLGPKCFFCNYIISIMKTLFESQKTFIVYKKFIKKFYYHLFLRNDKKNDTYLHQKGINFSWCMLNREGPSRIKKKLIAKIDYINNDELNKKFYDDHKDSKLLSDSKGQKQSAFDKSFDFFECKKKLVDILYADQIFQFNFVHYIVDENDTFVMAVNCLLFKGLTHFNCVFVIGEKKMYILKNLHIDKEDNLVYSKEKFSKAFWTLENYEEEWNSVCSYLNNFSPDKFDAMRKTTVNEISQDDQCNNLTVKPTVDTMLIKFSRNRRDFMIYSFSYLEINELQKRRFLHQNNAMEVFFKNGKNFLFAFNYKKRDVVFQKILECISGNLANKGAESILTFSNSAIQSNHCVYLRKSKLFIKKYKGKALSDSKQIVEESQEKWSQGIISNFDYLMILNTIGGRTYNDISQYPVLPWILKDYTTDINLGNDEFYRDLSYPIYAQDNRDKLKHKFEGAETEGKYHSGTHYSTPGFTSYYLIRLKPFSYYAAEIQGGYFDTADRLFFNIKSLWDVNEKYQELTPEVYYLPEMFINSNEFNFGTTQSQNQVRDVVLPNWARGDPRLYVKMTKKAMENCNVSEKINEWIDLIFGFKQQGPEAISSFNVLREACYPFDPNVWLMSQKKEIIREDNINNNNNTNQMIPEIIQSRKLDEELEVKLKEIYEMGQNPIQIFTRAHIKKDRHQKSFALFSLWTYLKLKDKEYKIKLDTTPTQIKGYYEVPDINLSRGEGGLSSFRMRYDGGDERNPKQADSLNTFFIVGKKKVLLGPNYKNFIDYSSKKYSFYLVKPASKVYFEFFTYRDSPINVIKSTDDGKYLIIGYNDGLICRYKLKSAVNERLIHPEYDKKKDKGILSRLFTKDVASPDKSSARLGTVSSKDVSSSVMMTSHAHADQSTYTVNENETMNYSSTPHLIYPRITFLTDEWRDYCIHSTCNTKLTKNLAKGTSYVTLALKCEVKFILNPIKLMEIGESYSLLIVVDTMNKIYLIDLSKTELLREIDFTCISKSHFEIKFVCICGHTGDFIVATSHTVVLFNVNGVLLGDLNLNDNVNQNIAKITSIAVKSLKNTESDIHLFTGHEDGNLIVWKLENKIIGSMSLTGAGMQYEIPHDIDFLDSYRFAYNREYFHEHVKKQFEIKLKFDSIIKIECKDKPLRLIKLTEDLSNLIIINDDMSLFYLGYEEYLLDKKKKTKQDKNCSLCGTQVGSSKILCQLCNKKLCVFCKFEVYIRK